MEKLNVSVVGQSCESCENMAELAVRGETDSFGYETIYLCSSCHKKMEAEQNGYLKAEDVEEKAPREGYTFVVSECYNADDGGVGFFHRTDSYRDARGFYRRCERAAERRCGLYPHKGVREVLIAEAADMAQRYRDALETEYRDFEEDILEDVFEDDQPDDWVDDEPAEWYNRYDEEGNVIETVVVKW
jgi:hypothetical protein